MTRGTAAAGALALAALVLAAAPPQPLEAQSLARRVAAVADGAVAFSYPVRPEVRLCEDGGWRIGSSHYSGGWVEGREPRCEAGPAEVVVEVRGSSVRSIELRPAFEGRGERVGARPLGAVPAEEAVGFLLSFARDPSADGSVAEEGLRAAVVADTESWPALLEIATDRALDSDLRKSALFWVGQAAARRVAPELAGIARDTDEEQEVRDAAVFALSRRPEAESVPLLMELGRTAEEPATRRTAIFWLARAEDPRVVEFFEEILLGRGSGGG